MLRWFSPGAEILATVLVKFTASPLSICVADGVRLCLFHEIPPFTLTALERINDWSLDTVQSDKTSSAHSLVLPARPWCRQ